MASSELTEESEDILLESCYCSYATEYEVLEYWSTEYWIA